MSVIRIRPVLHVGQRIVVASAAPPCSQGSRRIVPRRQTLRWAGAAQQATASFQFLLSMTIGQIAVVSDSHEAVGQNVQQEAADEFRRGDGHRPLLTLVGVVLVAERHLAILIIKQSTVGNRHPVRVASQVFQNATRIVEGPLGINHPLARGRGSQITPKYCASASG